ncbi:Yip1 family protein [Streptomyces sp. NPDC046215]|uniref:Yip1 domain-containing protein n=1 Tax=Streptomyces stramineus TaxID=173861 RepID=A0ABP3K339_9ACTN
MGRGRDSHDPAQQGQRPGQQYQAPYGGQGDARQWQQPSAYDEPEYFGGGSGDGGGRPGPDQYGRYGHGPGQDGGQYGGRGHAGPGPYGGGPQGPGPQDPYYGRTADNPGHTQQFSLGDAPDGYGGGPAPYPYDPQGDGSYNTADTYRAGQQPPPPVGPRLPWKELLTGIVLRPSATFWQMRDHAVWVPALIVTFVYGLLAVFGFDKAREDVLNSTFANSIPEVLITGVVVVISGLILGAVTHTLARQLGGDGLWQPTVGLSMLIMSLTDAPRLLFAMFLGGDSTLVQILGWATWLVAGALFTSMVSKSHDLPWPRALAASAIQLVALLSIIKLGTL